MNNNKEAVETLIGSCKKIASELQEGATSDHVRSVLSDLEEKCCEPEMPAEQLLEHLSHKEVASGLGWQGTALALCKLVEELASAVLSFVSQAEALMGTQSEELAKWRAFAVYRDHINAFRRKIASKLNMQWEDLAYQLQQEVELELEARLVTIQLEETLRQYGLSMADWDELHSLSTSTNQLHQTSFLPSYTAKSCLKQLETSALPPAVQPYKSTLIRMLQFIVPSPAP